MTGRARTARWVAGIALLALYVLPMYAPPATPAVDATTIRHDLVTRLFPEVPAWWILGRLAALAAGAALLASTATVFPLAITLADHASPVGSPVGRRMALVAAIAHVACFPWLAALSPAAQALYLAWLAVPAFVLAASGGRRAEALAPAIPRGVWMVMLALVGAWIAHRVPTAAHSPRLADLVDMWRTFSGLSRLVASRGNFLVDGIDPQLPGVNSTPLFFQGLSVLQLLGRAPTLDWVQAANTCWVAFAAIATGVVAARIVAPWAAPIAAATILGSPFLLLAQMTPCVVFLGSLATSVVGIAFVRVLAAASPASLAAFGAAAGLAATYPAVAPATGLALLVVAWRLATGPRLPPGVIITAALSFAAAFLPSLPSPDEFRKMVDLYVKLDGHASTLQATIFGQIPSMRGATTGWQTGRTGAIDIPLAALLSPFATSRMALRLWGDGLFDPLGAALAAVGIATCFRYARRHPAGLGVLAFLLATLATGFASSTDKPSLYRVFASPVVVATLAAAGYAVVAPAASRARTTLIAVAIVASGVFVFDHVNARVLERSAPGLALEALAGSPPTPAAIVTHPHEHHGWLYQEVIAREVPRTPLSLIDHAAIQGAVAGGTTIMFWSPAVEQTAGIAHAACTRWPGGTAFVIHDPSHHSRAHAFDTRGSRWTPSLPRARWEARACPATRPVLR